MMHKTGDDYTTIEEKAFGTIRSRIENPDFEWFHLQATIRTINNTIHAEVKQIGGPGVLLHMEDEAFEAEQAKIMDALRARLMELRGKLDSIWCKPDLDFTDFRDLVEECDGEGHKDCVAAMEEVWTRFDV